MREERKRRRAERAQARQEKLIADAFAALQLSSGDIHLILCLLQVRRNEDQACTDRERLDRLSESLRQAKLILQQRSRA
jgi:hypothetical protein